MRDFILLAFFNAYCWFVHLLFKLGAPAWLVNSLRLFVPDCLMLACSRAFQRRQQSQRAVPSSGTGDMAAVGHAVAHPTQDVSGAAAPVIADQQAQRPGGVR